MTLRGALVAREPFNRSGRHKASPSLFQGSRTHQGSSRCFVQLCEFRGLPRLNASRRSC